MADQDGISERSRRVAKNTILLYFRMILLMFIGLFTSRVVLNSLGLDDYGTYQTVFAAVMMFTALSNGVGTSISRFMAFELGKGDRERIRKVFSSAVFIQLGMCILLFILAESLGLWYLKNKIVIPEGREGAAMWAFQTSVVCLAVQLMSIPFNSIIVAHEDMKAYAWISILEGSLKLGLALTLCLTGFDKLKVYSVLMLVVALVIRGTYTLFCKKRYEETRGKQKPDKMLVRQMLSIGAWSFTANGVNVFNTKGVDLLSNSFFGVGINAVRGVAGQVENIVRQFVTNFLTALNPQIFKTWAEGDKDYCFALVRKGCKFSFLIVLLFAVPFIFESDFILDAWLVEVPDGAPLFTCLAVICVMMDFMSNSMGQLMLANGKVGKYYIVTSVISSLTFIGSYVAFKCGASPETAYCISAAVLLTISVARLLFTRRQCSFPTMPFVKEVIVPLAATAFLSVTSVWLLSLAVSFDSMLMHCMRVAVALLATGAASYFIALTKGERDYILNALRNLLKKFR